jgi:hypothetical protein
MHGSEQDTYRVWHSRQSRDHAIPLVNGKGVVLMSVIVPSQCVSAHPPMIVSPTQIGLLISTGKGTYVVGLFAERPRRDPVQRGEGR